MSCAYSSHIAVGDISRVGRSSRNSRTMFRRFALPAIILFLASAISVFVFVSISFAQGKSDDDNMVKAYKYITVEPNDTLWDIAATYKDYHYSSVYEYIREVKEINGITSDTIKTGARMIIPFYIERPDDYVSAGPYTY